jgi:dTDP-4-dehydrorhamnose 3,5-epimerase
LKFTPTQLAGTFVLEPEPIADERGFFARTWCADELARHGLVNQIAQASISYNRHAGTLRGMHYAVPPHAESKVVSCARGAIYDVLVDLRPGPQQRHWIAVELTAENRRMLFVPEGVAHGFLTLADDTEVSYLISEPYAADCARGVRYSDPAFAITWPSEPKVISQRDASYPDFAP